MIPGNGSQEHIWPLTGSGSSDEAADGWEETVATTGFAAAAPDIAAAVWMSAAADQVVILK